MASDDSISKAWDVIHDWLDQHAPALRTQLQPPASAQAIADLEALIGMELPTDFKASYRIHNGCESCSGLIIGLRLMPLEEIAREWTLASEQAKAGETLDGELSHEPDTIKDVVANAKWVPFAGPDEENYIGLDFDPGPRGTPGQVINYGVDQLIDETPRYVLAPTFGAFMQWLSERFASGDVTVCDTPEFLQTTRTRRDGKHCSLLTGLAMLFGEKRA